MFNRSYFNMPMDCLSPLAPLALVDRQSLAVGYYRWSQSLSCLLPAWAALLALALIVLRLCVW